MTVREPQVLTALLNSLASSLKEGIPIETRTQGATTVYAVSLDRFCMAMMDHDVSSYRPTQLLWYDRMVFSKFGKEKSPRVAAGPRSRHAEFWFDPLKAIDHVGQSPEIEQALTVFLNCRSKETAALEDTIFRSIAVLRSHIISYLDCSPSPEEMENMRNQMKGLESLIGQSMKGQGMDLDALDEIEMMKHVKARS